MDVFRGASVALGMLTVHEMRKTEFMLALEFII